MTLQERVVRCPDDDRFVTAFVGVSARGVCPKCRQHVMGVWTGEHVEVHLLEKGAPRR